MTDPPKQLNVDLVKLKSQTTTKGLVGWLVTAFTAVKSTYASLRDHLEGYATTKADAAQSAAEATAQTLASSASTTAQAAANSYADSAATLAQTQAQAYADGIVTVAEANAISTAAADASAKADTAQSVASALADDAQTDATQALAELDDIASDGKVTPVEKLEAYQRWESIITEGNPSTGTLPALATTFSVDDSAFDTAYSNLSTYLLTTLSLFTDMTATTDVTRATWDATWKAYYDARTALLNTISSTAKSLADAAQTAADDAQTDATQALLDAAAAQDAADAAQDDADAAQGTADANTTLLANIAADSKVTPVEKLEAKVRWNEALAEGHATTGTLTLKAAEFSVDDTDYATAYSALDTYLNTTLTVFSSMSATTNVTRATWDSKWGDYYTEKVNLLNAIAEAAADAAESAANAVAFPLADAGDLAEQDNVLASQIIAANLAAISAAFGEMSGGTITGTTIRTSDTGRRIQMDDEGIVFIVTDSTGKYGSFKYGDGTKYGAGWLCRFYNIENGIPFYMMNEQTVCDIHLFNRTTDPSGAAEVGDLAMVQGQLRQCSAAGTPGTWEDV